MLVVCSFVFSMFPHQPQLNEVVNGALLNVILNGDLFFGVFAVDDLAGFNERVIHCRGEPDGERLHGQVRDYRIEPLQPPTLQLLHATG